MTEMFPQRIKVMRISLYSFVVTFPSKGTSGPKSCQPNASHIITEPLDHCMGQAFTPVPIAWCTSHIRPHMENMAKDDSSDPITFFHISVDQSLCFLHH